MSTKSLPFPLLAMLIAALAALHFPGVSSAQGFTQMSMEKIELDPPAVVKIVKDADRDLEKDSQMAFNISVNGAPEVINMWSLQVQFTSPTLSFERSLSREIQGEMLYAIGEPTPGKEDGWATQNLAGISLNGWPNGELVKLLFTVNGNEGDEASIRLVPHPITPEGLAHESLEKRKLFEYNRLFDYTGTRSMPIVPHNPDIPPYVVPEREPRVIYSRD
ncbi:MAG: hypothetical protein JJU11_06885 [Candidatus Sumerlaeia bacterium]|nr:hypothetical protein [Candidatus Sumerlaeia bacterium]